MHRVKHALRMQILSLRELKYAVFDLETTGFYADQGDEIIEIGGVLVEGMEITKTFQSLVNPRRSIPAASTQVHGIKDEDVKDAPTIVEILPQFLQFVGGRILVAQNAKFDMSFIVQKFKQLQMPLKQTLVIDTIGLSKMIFQYENSHSLDKIMARLGIPRTGSRHRSLDDSRYTAQALIELIKLLEQQQIKTLPEIETAFVKPETLFRQEKAKSRSLF